MIKAITLDVAGTLIKPRAPVGEIYSAIAAHHGARLDGVALNQGFRSVFPRMPPMAFAQCDRTELERRERAWWRHLVQQVTNAAGGIEAFDAFFTELYDYFASGDAWHVYPEVLSFLRELERLHIPTAVVSNFDSRLLRVLSELNITPLVGPIFFSTAAASAKPDATIFNLAIDALELEASVCLHLGDDCKADLVGANNAGMQARLLVREGEQELGDAEIRNLSEALQLLA
jgi:putative hydrolase of the HAD superfamily